MRIQIRSFVLAALAGLIVFAAGSAQAGGSDFYFRLDGIAGESGPNASAQWLPLRAAAMEIDEDQPSGAFTGEVEGSRPMPKLMESVVTGRAFGDVELAIVIERDDEDGQATYLKYKLSRCFVKSWSTSGGADGAPPTIGFTLSYEKIEWEY